MSWMKNSGIRPYPRGEQYGYSARRRWIILMGHHIEGNFNLLGESRGFGDTRGQGNRNLHGGPSLVRGH